MRKLVRHFIIVHTVMLFVVGFGVWFVLERFFPDMLIDSYFVIPAFFYVAGLVLIVVLRRMPKNQPRQMVNLYMLLRVIKMLAALGIVAIYWFLDRAQIRSFATIFAVFYLIYLIIETYIYSKMEIFLKMKEKENHPKIKKPLKDQ